MLKTRGISNFIPFLAYSRLRLFSSLYLYPRKRKVVHDLTKCGDEILMLHSRRSLTYEIFFVVCNDISVLPMIFRMNLGENESLFDGEGMDSFWRMFEYLGFCKKTSYRNLTIGEFYKFLQWVKDNYPEALVKPPHL